MRRWLAAGAITMLFLTSGNARAQTAEQKAIAENLFEEGRALLVKADYAAACPKLSESQRIDPSIGTGLYLGACYEKSGKTASAWATFKEAQELAERQGDAKRAQLAQQRAAALEPQLARITIVVPPDARPPGLVVKRDGIEIMQPIWGSAVPVDPGTHVIEASAPLRLPFRREVNAESGAVINIDVPKLDEKAETAVTPPPPVTIAKPVIESPRNPPPQQDVETGSTQRKLGLLAAGVGVVGLGLGIASQIQTSSLLSDAKSDGCDTSAKPIACPNGGAGLDGFSKLHDARTTWRPLAITGFVAGGVLLAGGAALYFTAKNGDARAEPRAESHVSLVPAFDGRSGGAMLTGAF
jgi:hypothetical protein